jgi:hypothetical protein
MAGFSRQWYLSGLLWLFVDSNHPYNYAVLGGCGKIRPELTSQERGSYGTETTSDLQNDSNLETKSNITPNEIFEWVRRAS